MKEKLYKFLFGEDTPIPEQTPEHLFKEDWESDQKCRKNHIALRAAQLIVEMIPDSRVDKSTIKWGDNLTTLIQNQIIWNNGCFLNELVTSEPKPLKSKDEFIQFICRHILESEKGGVQ